MLCSFVWQVFVLVIRSFFVRLFSFWWELMQFWVLSLPVAQNTYLSRELYIQTISAQKPKALYIMAFGSQSLRIQVLRALGFRVFLRHCCFVRVIITGATVVEAYSRIWASRMITWHCRVSILAQRPAFRGQRSSALQPSTSECSGITLPPVTL